MTRLYVLSFVALALCSCASKAKKQNYDLLEKYPHCYNVNTKISDKCIQKNEAGENVTALQLENTALPGQYK